jgi:cell division protein FtsW (lipid II flippase)
LVGFVFVVVFFVSVFVMFFVAGFRVRHLLTMILLGVPALVAAMLAKSLTWVRDRMYIGRLDGDGRALVLAGKLPLIHAQEIARVADPKIRAELEDFHPVLVLVVPINGALVVVGGLGHLRQVFVERLHVFTSLSGRYLWFVRILECGACGISLRGTAGSG